MLKEFMFKIMRINQLSLLVLVSLINASNAMEDNIIMGMQKLAIDDEARTLPLRGNKRKNALNVLVADDNSVNLKVIARHLGTLGDNIVTVENGLQVLEAMQNNKFDILLSDGEMPVMDGPTAIGKVRELGIPLIPMYILTSNHEQRFIDLCRSKGVKDVLFKPITFEVLKDTLEPYRKKPSVIEYLERNPPEVQHSSQNEADEK
jgi:CheY-like chemotaxis protein